MTSKSLFFNLMKEDAKRRLWTIALTFVAFFFSFPVWTALIFKDFEIGDKSSRLSVISDLKSLFSFHNGWIAMLFILLSLIMGVTSFSYLHSRQKVDFYHGIPVSRTKLFWANYANGILIPGVIYGINLVAAMIVAMVNGIAPQSFAATMGTAFFLFLIHYSMIYSVTVVSMVLTGNSLIGILGTGVFHFFFPMVLTTLEMYYQVFFHTSYQGGNPFFELLMDKCSAFTLFISNIMILDGDIITINQALRVVSVLVLTVLLALLAFFLHKKRGSEAAGKALAFPISKPIIRNPIVILSSLCGSLFFFAAQDSLGWALFGLVCGMLLSHCVIEIIYHFDFRKLFADRIQMGLCALAAFCVFGGFRYDWFGYDSYIPSASQIESVAIADDLNSWIDYGKVSIDSDRSYYWRYEGDDDYKFNNMKLTNTEEVLSLVKQGIKRNNELYHSGLDAKDRRLEYRDYGTQDYRFSVKYNLKSGKSIYRSYTIVSNVEERLPEVMELYRDQNFLHGVYPILVQTPENTARVRVSVGEQTITASRDKNGTDKAMTEKLLTTYQEEFKNLTPETMEKENPIATIQFMTRDQADAEEKREEARSSWLYGDVTDRGYYPLYPSFKKTMALLRECQVDIEGLNKVKGEVETIYFELDSYGKSRMEPLPELMIDDPEEISQIMKDAVIVDYSHMNPMNTEQQVTFTAVEKTYSSERSTQCTIGISKLSDEIIAKITRPEEE